MADEPKLTAETVGTNMPWWMYVPAAIVLILAWAYYLPPLLKFQFWQPDTFWLIEIGRLILEKHAIPTHDIYSFTSSAKCWIVYQWLTEVIFSLAHSAGGLAGVAAVGALILTLVFSVLLPSRMVQKGVRPLVALVAAQLAASAFFPYVAALRPQLLSFLFFWLLATVCDDCIAKPENSQGKWKPIATTLAISIIWANCHLSFVLGLVLLGSYFLGSLIEAAQKKPERVSPVLFASMTAIYLVGTLITPQGIRLWTFLVLDKSFQAIPTPELQPLNWLADPVTIFIICLAVAACITVRKKLAPGLLIALAVLFAIGNNCGRLIIYFYLLSSPIIGMGLNEFITKRQKRELLPRLNGALNSAILSPYYAVLITTAAAVFAISQPPFIRNNIPVAATKFLVQHPSTAHLFCDAQCGSYLIYKTHGQIPVFFDTRLDLYDPEFVLQFVMASNLAESWQDLFAKYNITSALLNNSTKLKAVLDQTPGWKCVYSDDLFSVYTKVQE